ncbi:TRAFAC clade GTPase domain-containing protein [Lentzea sp. HUAS TT2]|uniref:TRAFAC clade GTPase domain-containing protein n=1 Tax=Lentzea sp. HUAS TT2 TaxID=3447454 RepID=UPI003F6F524D
MTTSHRQVRCPVCADEFEWPDEPMVWLYNQAAGRYEAFDVSTVSSVKQADLRRGGYRKCPNPSGDMVEHFIPASYGDYGEPLVIGLVGAPSSGKTHLLTSMVRQMHINGLASHGITVSALDFLRHRRFREQFITPLEQGGALPGTGTGMTEAADILLLRAPTGDRPLVFFDVAGEDLVNPDARNRSTRFLLGVDAVIFVHASEDPLETGQSSTASENRSFELAIERLRDRRIPAAIVVTKSDRLRFVPPAERWLHGGDEHTVNAARIRAESRDVYAYLHHAGAGASLRPFEAFPRCTLHFTSASGGDAVPVETDGPTRWHFPRGFRPSRVLEPLVSILAMTGAISGHEAEKVGMP